MRGRLIGIVALPLVLAGCGGLAQSPINPLNWFGGREAPEPVSPLERPADPRPLIDQVTSVTIDRTPGGAIVRATGLPPALGYWNAGLVPVDRDARPDANGVLTLEFRAVPPPAPVPGPTANRSIVAGYFLSNQTLAGVRAITVTARTNSATARR
jgi:hypothetical protein